VKRIRDVAGRSALVTAALVVALSGCSALSPTTTEEPYPASDGAELNLPGSAVRLRNFIVVGAEKGAPAVVVGAVINSGPTAAQVRLQTDLGETAQPTETVIQVGANSSVQIGPEQKFEMLIPELPVEPGASTAFSAATDIGGRAELTVPVLRPEHEYADLTPAPTSPSSPSSPSPTSTGSPTSTAATSADPTTKKSAKKPAATSTPDSPSAEPTNS
jgi:hypothetical protein